MGRRPGHPASRGRPAPSVKRTNSTKDAPSWLAQGPDADLLEIDDIAGVVILQADVAGRRPFRPPLRLEPLAIPRHILAVGVEGGDLLAVDLHQHEVALEGDHHGLPLIRPLL